jgi:Xaa-Pro aminopeptidase
VSGKFTRVQRDVYEIVLAAQKACIAGAINGVRNSELHRLSQMVLAAGLKDMGILKCRPDEAVDSDAIRIFYPHGLGHMLGVDVHDCTGGKRHKLPGPKPKGLRFDSVLRPGMVVTIEPGLYFIPALLEDKDLRRMHKARIAFSKTDRLKSFGGVRIEDNVVIREKGQPLNLTSVPKEVADVEAACAGAWEA